MKYSSAAKVWGVSKHSTLWSTLSFASVIDLSFAIVPQFISLSKIWYLPAFPWFLFINGFAFKCIWSISQGYKLANLLCCFCGQVMCIAVKWKCIICTHLTTDVSANKICSSLIQASDSQMIEVTGKIIHIFLWLKGRLFLTFYSECTFFCEWLFPETVQNSSFGGTVSSLGTKQIYFCFRYGMDKENMGFVLFL